MPGSRDTGTLGSDQRWFPVKNVESSEDFPPWSWIMLDDGERTSEADGHRAYAKAKKYDGSSDKPLALTGPLTIKAGRYGSATQDFPAWMAYDSADGTPANGDQYGPESGEFVGKPGGSEVIVIGAAVTDETPKRVLVARDAGGSRLLLCKYVGTTEALGPRNTGGIVFEGDCEVYDYAVTGATAPDPILEGTASGKYCKGIILPNQLFWARYTNGKCWAIEGAQNLVGTAAEDLVGGTGDVAFTWDRVESVDIECTDFCGKNILSGASVLVNVTFSGGLADGCTLNIVRSCCPELEE